MKARSSAIFTVLFLALSAWLTPAVSENEGTQLVQLTITQSYEWLEVELEFSPGVPTYTYHFVDEKNILNLTMLETRLGDLALPEDGAIDVFPLVKITSYEGAVNSSLAFHLAYDSERLVSSRGSTLTIKFPRRVESAHSVEIGGGVTWNTEEKQVAGRPLRYDWLLIPPGAKVKTVVRSAAVFDGAVRTGTLDWMADQAGAIAGVNAGFFNAQGFPVSTLVEDGVLVTSGRYPSRPMILVLDDGSLRMGRFTVRPELVVDGKVIPLSGFNTELKASETVVYSWSYPFEDIPLSGFLYHLESGALKPVSGEIKELENPDEYYIATLIMPEANPLKGIPADSSVELRVRVYDRTSGELIEVAFAVGGAPMLVEDGEVSVSSAEDRVREDITKNPRARTAAALLNDGSLLLVVVSEVREHFYKGVKLGELGEWLVRKGARVAFNLDGGGSSQLVVAGSLVTPYSGKPRRINNAILILPEDEQH